MGLGEAAGLSGSGTSQQAAGKAPEALKPVTEAKTPPTVKTPQPPSLPTGAPSTGLRPATSGPGLKDEIEEAKKAGIQERRGIGRRAADTHDVEKQFIRVNIERLDNLMNLVGEMVVNRNRLARQSLYQIIARGAD
jgi:two-component system chemotaxis sensor kinase CheA